MSLIFSVWTFEILGTLGILNVILQELCDDKWPKNWNLYEKHLLGSTCSWIGETRLSFPQQQQFQCCALLEADMFRHVLPGNNNACLICHEIMKRDPAGYLTGCRLMVYYMGVKHKAGGPRTGPAQRLWAGFYPLTAGFTAFLTHSHSCYTKLTIKWQKLLTFHDQI